jgi:hypothetical protein
MKTDSEKRLELIAKPSGLNEKYREYAINATLSKSNNQLD